jgi:hypothetical protein
MHGLWEGTFDSQHPEFHRWSRSIPLYRNRGIARISKHRSLVVSCFPSPLRQEYPRNQPLYVHVRKLILGEAEAHVVLYIPYVTLQLGSSESDLKCFLEVLRVDFTLSAGVEFDAMITSKH